MKQWLHEDFMYIKETALSDRLEHVERLEKQFKEKKQWIRFSIKCFNKYEFTQDFHPKYNKY